MPSVIMLIALPTPMPVINITKLQSAEMVKDFVDYLVNTVKETEPKTMYSKDWPYGS